MTNTPPIDPAVDQCPERTIFWPDDEACDAVCMKKAGHKGQHEDEILGEWSDDE